MLRVTTRKKLNRFFGNNKSVYTIRREKDLSIYAAFIIKPFKQVENGKEKISYKYRWEKEKSERNEPLLSVLNEVKLLNLSLHRMFIPGLVKKKNGDDKKEKKKDDQSSLLEELLEEDNQNIDVSLSFFILRVWKEYNLSATFDSIDDLVEDFRLLLKNELKQKLEGVGKVGRLLDNTLEEIVLYSTLDYTNFLTKGNKVFSTLTKEYAVIEKSDQFQRSFLPGPAVDKRPESIFSYPTGIETNSSFLVGLSESNIPIGLPENPSFPILIAGDKKTREISTSNIIEQNGKFIILDPRSNLEFENRIRTDFEVLKLGENFTFNVLTPVTNDVYVSEQLSNQYLGNFIELVRAVSDVRNEASVLFRDLIEFYVNEYQEEQEDILFPKHDTPVSLNDLYTMLTIEPGGLVITDYQLSTVRALINDIRDPSISENTRINETRGLEELLKSSRIINFSSQGFKIQKLFLYSFLLQLTVVSQVMNIEEEILIYIDDAELFFSREIDRTILSHILKKLENSPFKLVFSTPYPSQLSSTIFDLTHNRIIGNLKSARCLKLIADTHGLDKNQLNFIRRLPRNNFILIREDLFEKPFLLRFLPEDIDRYETQPIKRKKKQKDISKEADDTLTVNIDDFARLHPIMLEILEKLSLKVNRGINSESIARLFTNWEISEVKETVSILEMFGYIFFETVDKKGKKGEYWTRITPRGKKFLEKLKFSEVISSKNKELDTEDLSEKESSKSEEKEKITDYIESSNVNITRDQQDSIISKLQTIRRNIKETRDSEKNRKVKFEQLSSLLTQVREELDDSFDEERVKLNNYLTPLNELLKEDKSIQDIPEKIVMNMFQKALSIVDAIQIKATFGDKSKNGSDEEFIEKVIEQELNSEKWKDFNREVFLTEIPELTAINKTQKKIINLITSELPEEVLQGLELSAELPKDEFVRIVKRSLASLLQIKTMFYPNMDTEKYLEEVKDFFETSSIPEPFEKSKKLLWEYSALDQADSKKNPVRKNRREIIESIQEESQSFDFDLDDKSKDNFVEQLIKRIKKRINKGG